MAKARSRRPARANRSRAAAPETAADVADTDAEDAAELDDTAEDDAGEADATAEPAPRATRHASGADADDADDEDDDTDTDDDDTDTDDDDTDDEDEDDDEDDDSELAVQRERRRAKARRRASRTGGGSTRRQRLAELEASRKRESRRRSLILLGICLVCALGLLAYPVFVFAQDAVLRATPRAELGVPAADAGCLPIRTNPASGNQQHVPDGTVVPYDRLPPDSGPHYDHWAPFDTKFYTMADRPPVEVLVHNLEHGYILAWYDVDNMSSHDVKVLKAIASTFNSNDPSSKFIAAPWSVSKDGGSFPAGTHLALSRWTADVDATTGAVGNQQGVQEFCGRVSGEVIEAFHVKYPADKAPEPSGG